MTEYEIEPVPGLPEPLPQGEQILWQGSPSWRGLLIRALHVRVIIGYFLLLAAWRVASDMEAGTNLATAAGHALPVLLVGMVPVVLAGLYAWLAARSALYTITNKRVVMRFGLALPVVLNLPFSKIATAALATHADGTGDIPLAPHVGEAAGAPVSLLMVWPHARPGYISRPQPMLRSIADPAAVAGILSGALSAANGQLPLTGFCETSSPRIAPARASPAVPVAARGEPDLSLSTATM